MAASKWLGIGLGLAALGCSDLYWVCDPPDEGRLGQLPAKLSETGLFSDVATEALAPGVSAYRPRYALWSDGAEKRRWFWLPEGERIDTSNADNWSFPVGTKFWKEFTRNGVRVETRLLQRWGSAQTAWSGVAYVWNDDQSDAVLTPYGAIDAHGTPHDVPAASECMACHGGSKSVVLGFSAIQLGAEAEPDEIGLSALEAADVVSDPVTPAPEIPGTDVERDALGYLHANCAHCHNQDRPARHGARCFDPDNDLDFKLRVGALGSVAQTPTRKTIDDVVKAGAPGQSRLIELMANRGMFKQMPPLATEKVDRAAVTLLESFIEGLH
jgi:hypothetical protein